MKEIVRSLATACIISLVSLGSGVRAEGEAGGCMTTIECMQQMVDRALDLQAMVKKQSAQIADLETAMSNELTARDTTIAGLLARIEGLQNRRIECTSYARGRTQGGVPGWSDFALCGRQDEQAVSCTFGSNLGSYSIITENGFEGCRRTGADWAAATCCRLVDGTP